MKLCPFSGNEPERLTDRQTEKYACKNIGCPIFEVPFTFQQWETRASSSGDLEVFYAGERVDSSVVRYYQNAKYRDLPIHLL